MPPLRPNQPGFVAGGPVYIPKLYNGRNKTFWLVNHEGLRVRQGTDFFGNVPSAENLAGRFSTPSPIRSLAIPFRAIQSRSRAEHASPAWPSRATRLMKTAGQSPYCLVGS